MINLFNFINDILYKKQGNLLKDSDAEGQFNPYMINRWVSMYSPDACLYVNVLNKYWNVYETKSQWYKMLISFLPRYNYKKINYIKKEKEKLKSDPNRNAFIETLAKSMDMSKKEINTLISDNNIDITKYIKGMN